MATHFDPTTAKCYKFGSTGGKLTGDGQDLNNGNLTNLPDDNNFYSILKDLTENSDRMWLVLIILISLSIILILIIFMLVRKHYLGYCWTTHKKEYEPNNKNAPKNGYFNKNSINNKSFRKKNVETDEDEDIESAADNRAFVTTNTDDKRSSGVKVNIDDNHRQDTSEPHNGSTNNQYHHNHHLSGPLISSTSTPV